MFYVYNVNMKLTNVVYKSGYTQDGHLNSNQGRIVIYNDQIVWSKGNSQDHLYLLHALASRYHFKKDDVISNAIRLYFTIENNVLIVSQNRKIDEDALSSKFKHYGKLIFRELGK